jgi:hypothetical protein
LIKSSKLSLDPAGHPIGLRVVQLVLLIVILAAIISDKRLADSQSEFTTQNSTVVVKPVNSSSYSGIETYTINSESFKMNPSNNSVPSYSVRNSPYDVTNASSTFSKNIIVGTSSAGLPILETTETTISPPSVAIISGTVKYRTPE